MNKWMFGTLVALVGFAAHADEFEALKQVHCEVTAVDQTPVYFLGPSGSFPHVGSSIDLDLTAMELTKDLVFAQGGHIPLEQVGAKLVKDQTIGKLQGTGIVYFDGQFISPSRATYTLAIHVAPEGAGKLQIARRGFVEQLELYNAQLHCTPKT